MPEPTRGYIEAPNFYPSPRAWKAYTAYCARERVPRVLIALARYWKVEIDARTTQDGRFIPGSLRWFRELAEAYIARSESGQARCRVMPARMTVYGLSRDDARAFAAEAVNRFSALHGFISYPAEPSPPPIFTPPRPKVIDLAAERRKRRTPWGDPAS